MMLKYLKQLTQISIINFIFIVGLLFFIQRNMPSPSPKKNSLLQTTATSVLSPSLTQISSVQSQVVPSIVPSVSVPKNLFSELSIHNTKSDCWLAVGGHIYDVTTYFGSHPGGDDVILKYCGTDATGPFQSKDGIGVNHSASAYDLLRQYLIQ